MQDTIYCGFSANPEIYNEFVRRENGKHEITQDGIVLSGSSINIAKCIQNMNHNAHALILTGPKNGILSTLYYNALLELLHTAGLPYTHFEVLKTPSIAWVPIEKDDELSKDAELYGKKNIDPDKLKNAYNLLDNLNQDIRWAALSGVKISELPLVKIVLSKAEVGKRLLIPKAELVESPKFEEVLRNVDLLIMNKSEFGVYHSRSIEDLHKYGPKFIIVTDSANGGYFSTGNGVTHYDAFSSSLGSHSKVGCGDWFAGAIVSWILENHLNSFNLTQNQALQATEFAAKVAAKKLSYQGGSVGPKREDII